MPINPSRSGNPVDPHNFGTYRYDAQNDVTNTNRQKHNNFRYNRSVLCTPRFGEITPFELLYCVPDDVHNFGNSVDLRTYTMKSPQFAGMKMHKDYYQVPLSSILPQTWQLWYKNPLKGDDVPDDVYPNWFLSPMPLFNAMTMIFTGGSESGSSLSATTEISGSQFFDFWYYLSVLYHVFSSGSLPCQLGIPSHRLFRFKTGTVTDTSSVEESDYMYIDDYFERFFGSEFKMVIEFSKTSTFSYPIARYDLRNPADFRKWMNFCFSNYALQIGETYDKIHKAVYCNVWYYKDAETTLKTSILLNQVNQSSSALANVLLCPFQDNQIPIFFAEYSSSTTSIERVFGVFVWSKEQDPSIDYAFNRKFNGDNFFPLSSISKNIDYVYDISPLIAYHQLCAQFFTVDAVDNIFDSKTWMQNMSSLITTSTVSQKYPIFDFNGISIQYDIFSSRVLSEFLGIQFARVGQNIVQQYTCLGSQFTNYYNYRAFIYNLFSYEESLLYGDYFTGARLEPLAVGDVTVDVADNVNVVDIARSDWKARFLNFINRTGSQIQDYINGLFGVQPQQLDPLPKAIVHQEISVQSYEVENQNFNPDATDPTQLQGYPVSLMRASAGSPQMSVIVTEPSFVIGVLSFEFRRFYDGVTDRQLFTRDRFDTFNPYLQNLGDQSIYSAEAFPFLSVDPEDPIAYQLRDTHYKQRVDVARGAFCKGFVKLLPSWARVVDLSTYALDSEHIRNHNEDLDEFYSILSGNSLRSYFHFICLIQNIDDASRPMQAKPLLKF